MTYFKAGDRVVCTNDYNSTNKVGRQGVVLVNDGSSYLPIKVRFDCDLENWDWKRPEDLRLVSGNGQEQTSVREQIEALEASIIVLKQTLGL